QPRSPPLLFPYTTLFRSSVGLVEAPDVDPRAARVKLIGSHREEIAPIMAEGHVRWPRRGGELLQKRYLGGLLVYRKHRDGAGPGDRKSTRLNSSHEWISY